MASDRRFRENVTNCLSPFWIWLFHLLPFDTNNYAIRRTAKWKPSDWGRIFRKLEVVVGILFNGWDSTLCIPFPCAVRSGWVWVCLFDWSKLRTLESLIIASGLVNHVDVFVSNDEHFRQALPSHMLRSFTERGDVVYFMYKIGTCSKPQAE